MDYPTNTQHVRKTTYTFASPALDAVSERIAMLCRDKEFISAAFSYRVPQEGDDNNIVTSVEEKTFTHIGCAPDIDGPIFTPRDRHWEVTYLDEYETVHRAYIPYTTYVDVEIASLIETA